MKENSTNCQSSQMRLNDIFFLEEINDEVAVTIVGGNCQWSWEVGWYSIYKTGEKVSYDGKTFYECQPDGSWKEVPTKLFLGSINKLLNT